MTTTTLTLDREIHALQTKDVGRHVETVRALVLHKAQGGTWDDAQQRTLAKAMVALDWSADLVERDITNLSAYLPNEAFLEHFETTQGKLSADRLAAARSKKEHELAARKSEIEARSLSSQISINYATREQLEGFRKYFVRYFSEDILAAAANKNPTPSIDEVARGGTLLSDAISRGSYGAPPTVEFRGPIKPATPVTNQDSPSTGQRLPRKQR